MVKDLVISSSPEEVTIGLLEDRQLAELHTDKKGNNFAVGDIYLGKIKKIVPSLNAAFVDVGHEKDAFLHYFDLGPQIRSALKYTKSALSTNPSEALLNNFHLEKDIDKAGKISGVLTSNQWILVQIAKEPISTKGPRITSELALAGRDMVLTPFANHISISQKINSEEERSRLKRLVQSIKPKNFGVIIRTAADGKKVADLDKDMRDLVGKWETLHKELRNARPPQKVLGEMSRASTILRDILSPDFQNIHVNDQVLYDEIKNYIRAIVPEKEEIVKLYKGKVPIFENFGVDKQIKTLFGKTVTITSGAYLIIEHTEALHVIDVNSGTRTKQGDDQEENALQVNLDAAKEVARQLRLRDIGGIIVVDFIDMHKATNRKLLFDKIREEMSRDRAKHNILPPSKFGLIQITRQRVRPETKIAISEKCPACGGSGEIKPSILLIDEIENNLQYLLREQNEKSVTLCVHPFIEAYLTKGLFSSIKKKWRTKFKKKIDIRPVSSYHFTEYHFLNQEEEEIKL